jgi:hypothetical protein
MNTLEAQLKLNIAAFQTELMQSRNDMRGWVDELRKEGRRGAQALDPILQGWQGVSHATRGMTTNAGSATRNLSGMSMQLQDIVVQLQSGTSAAVVFTQQGSQMLSLLGPGGAIIGGAAAVGGAMVTMAQHAGVAFKDFNAQADLAHAKMEALRVSITSENIASGLQTAREEMSKLSAEAEKVSGFGSEMGTNLRRMARTIGLPGFENEKSQEEKNRLVNDKLIQSERDRKAVIDAALASSTSEVEVARLRGAGLKDEADQMQHKLDVARKLAQIEADPNLPRRAKDQLKGDFLSKDNASQSALQFDKESKAKQEIARIQAKLKEDTLSTLSPHEKFIELSKQQEAIFSRMAEEGGIFYEQSIAGLEAWSEALSKLGKTEKQLEVLKMLDEARTLESKKRDAAEETASARDKRDREADAKRDEIQRVKDKMAAEQERFSQQFKAREEAKRQLGEDLAIERARKAGDTDKVKELEQQRDVRRKTRDIMEQTGMNESQSRRAAFMLMSDSSVAPSRRARLMGAGDEGSLRDRGGVRRPSRGFAGLDEFTLNQMMPVGANAISNRRALPLQDHAEQNAARSASNGDAWQSSFIMRLKSELSPALAEQIGQAILNAS